MSGWGCVHEVEGACSRVAGRPCDPGMKGCILAGRFRFSNEEKNRPPRRQPNADTTAKAGSGPADDPVSPK